MLCIVCVTEALSSREHVFPERIGGRLEIDRVCTGCNSDLGTNIDVALTDDALILFARHRHLGHTGALTRAFGPGVLADGTHVLPYLNNAVAPLGLNVRGERCEIRMRTGRQPSNTYCPLATSGDSQKSWSESSDDAKRSGNRFSATQFRKSRWRNLKVGTTSKRTLLA